MPIGISAAVALFKHQINLFNLAALRNYTPTRFINKERKTKEKNVKTCY